MKTKNVKTNKVRIGDVISRELLDSKGRPMVEVEVRCTDGSLGRGASPAGSSVGSHEVLVLRDDGPRFGGLGVQKAVRNVREIIGPALIGRSVFEQQQIDDILIQLDGTPNKSILGGNAIYSTSIAIARAAANASRIPLHQYLTEDPANTLPVPMFNMINGGIYGDVKCEIQEFLLFPVSAPSFSEALRMGSEVFYKLKSVISCRYGANRVLIGNSAGYAAPVNDPADIIQTMLMAVSEAGYENLLKVGLDCAATHFFDTKDQCYNFQGKRLDRGEIVRYLSKLVETYSIVFVEDPLNEEDFEGFALITRQMKIIVAGDDLFVTSRERLQKAIDSQAGNAIVFKPNMIGTVSEALDVARLAKKNGYLLVPSVRSGGSVDDPIADFAVAIGGELMKCGAPRSGERTNIQNHLLRLEEVYQESIKISQLKRMTI